MFDDDVAAARQEIADRLDALELNLRRLPAREIAQTVHSLKGLAAAFEFKTVAALAHALESEVGGFGRAAMITSYLDCMHDALALGTGEHPGALDKLLASVGARLTAA